MLCDARASCKCFSPCGVTPQGIIAAAWPHFITHAPGRMLATDLKSAQLAAI